MNSTYWKIVLFWNMALHMPVPEVENLKIFCYMDYSKNNTVFRRFYYFCKTSILDKTNNNETKRAP
jgi:hypothetical protein